MMDDDVAAHIRMLLDRVKTLEYQMSAVNATTDALRIGQFLPTVPVYPKSYMVPIQITSIIDDTHWSAVLMKVRAGGVDEFGEETLSEALIDDNAREIEVTCCGSDVVADVDDYGAALWAGKGYVLVTASTQISFGMAISDESTDGVLQVNKIRGDKLSTDPTTMTVIRSSTMTPNDDE